MAQIPLDHPCQILLIKLTWEYLKKYPLTTIKTKNQSPQMRLEKLELLYAIIDL
jgi:hypothetical protein